MLSLSLGVCRKFVLQTITWVLVYLSLWNHTTFCHTTKKLVGFWFFGGRLWQAVYELGTKKGTRNRHFHNICTITSLKVKRSLWNCAIKCPTSEGRLVLIFWVGNHLAFMKNRTIWFWLNFYLVSNIKSDSKF